MTAAVPLVERLAEVIHDHRGIEQATRPARRKGITEWFAKCVCGEEMPWPKAERDDAHRAHVARALLPVVEQVVAEARGEALREAADFIADTAGIGESANDFGRGWYGALDYAVGSIRDRAEANATTEAHDCASCPDCLHDGHKCCGCYDGACCRREDTP